mgnify:CR=1 FL=1
MNYHQSNVFLQDLSNSFIVGSTFYSSFRSANNSWWCFSSSFSTFEDRRRVSLKSCSILFKIHGSSLMPSSHNCFRLWEFFSPIRSISWVVSISFLRRPSGHNSSFSACSYRSPNLTGESFKYPLISSWSLRSHVSKSPQVSSFVFQFFPVNCAFATSIFQFLRWFVQDFTSFVIISIHSLFQSYRWFVEDLLKFTLYLS